MKTILKLILPILIALISMYFSGCIKERIVGNGNVINENRSSAAFSRIISSGDFLVTVVPDSVTSIKVEAESNIVPYVNTGVNGNTVIIDFDAGVNIHEHSPIKVTLHTLHSEYLELQGSGNITSGNFTEDDVQLYLSGSGNIMSSFIANTISAGISGSGGITLEGKARQATMYISGSGNISSLHLIQDICNASIAGSGNVYINVIRKINATISGSGSIFYLGNPSVESNISGSGKVVKYQ